LDVAVTAPKNLGVRHRFVIRLLTELPGASAIVLSSTCQISERRYSELVEEASASA